MTMVDTKSFEYENLANIVKSSSGTIHKMLSDDIVVNFIIANDVNTFLKLPEVEHPAAKILVNLNKFHDQTFRCHYF
ncbi:T-complex 1 subunit alpha [Brachionus plicatilis]|uniref:T-complex 1 subunit alpha n=1 Tax=Brachionus plicatilis TaxID=10195 RepID=A0A3M7PLY2_BRAPC|nr:T-complex 1 subunit alpha [Brachionus plicatilis]